MVYHGQLSGQINDAGDAEVNLGVTLKRLSFLQRGAQGTFPGAITADPIN